jgi:endonuclease IV
MDLVADTKFRLLNKSYNDFITTKVLPIFNPINLRVENYELVSNTTIVVIQPSFNEFECHHKACLNNRKLIILILPYTHECRIIEAREMKYDPFNIIKTFNIGNSYGYCPNILSFIGDIRDSIVQVYLRDSKEGTYNPNIDNLLDGCKELVMRNNIKLYVHAMLAMNTCAKGGRGVTSIIEDMNRCFRLGGRGVVMHVGSLTHKWNSVDNMELNIKNILSKTSGTLFVETSSGEGKDVCWKFEEFRDFFNRFNAVEKSRIKICADLCHIHSSGYEPHLYIRRWLEESDVPIGLVHYNDSKNPIGSRIDRHAFVGDGYIGCVKMYEVALICREKGIDMLLEC